MAVEDRVFPGTEYATAEQELKRLAAILLPISTRVMLIGVWLILDLLLRRLSHWGEIDSVWHGRDRPL